MANALITPTIIAKEALFHLENNLVLADRVHRAYKNEFVKIGNSVNVRKPVKFITTSGAARSNQDVLESNTTITIDSREHVSWKFQTDDLTLTIDDYAERYIKPAMIALANKVDVDIAQEGTDKFFNLVGTAGSTPDAFSDLSDVAKRMDNLSIPDDGQRCLVVNPDARWALANGLGGTGSGGVFNADIVHGMVRRGRLGELANLDIYGDQNIIAHQTGTFSGSPVVATPLITDEDHDALFSTLAYEGMTGTVANVFRVGDVITIAGVNAVNDISKADLGFLKEFVVTAASATTAGAGTVTIAPALNEGGTTSTAAYQNVSALPLAAAVIAFKGAPATGVAYPHNLAFHRNAIALVTVPLQLPDSVTFKARAEWRGLSIRVVKDYDIGTDDEIIRLDILYGVDAIYPDLGVKLIG